MVFVIFAAAAIGSIIQPLCQINKRQLSDRFSTDATLVSLSISHQIITIFRNTVPFIYLTRAV